MRYRGVRGRRTGSWWPALAMARECAAAAGTRSVGSQHVLLALLGPGTGVAEALHGAGLDRPTVLAALQGITGVGRARAEPVPVEQVAVSPRVGALLRRAAGERPGEIDDVAVLGQLLDDHGEPSVAHAVLASLGARRRALAVYRGLVDTRIGRTGGDLVPS